MAYVFSILLPGSQSNPDGFGRNIKKNWNGRTLGIYVLLCFVEIHSVVSEEK